MLLFPTDCCFLFSGVSSAIAQTELVFLNASAPPRLVNNLSKQFPNFLSSQEESQLEKSSTILGIKLPIK